MPASRPQPFGEYDADTVLRAQRAFIALNELDRVLLTNSGGRLHPLIPLDPFHGIQRAYAWDGIGPPHFVQVSASARRHSNGDYEWTWPTHQIHQYARLTMLAVVVDPVTGQIEDPAWVFSPRGFRQIAYVTEARGHPQYWIAASPHGHDRFWRHRVPLNELWKHIAPSDLHRSERPWVGHGATRDEGTVYEQLVAADWIWQSRGRLAVYRPAMDIAGRDYLVQLANSPKAIFVQVKGTIKIIRGSVIQIMVKRPTFHPAEDFWFAFYFFDVAEGRLWKDCWLVPSLDFADLTKDQHFPGSIGFHVTLNGKENRWLKYRHDIDNQAAVLHKALISLSR